LCSKPHLCTQIIKLIMFAQTPKLSSHTITMNPRLHVPNPTTFPLKPSHKIWELRLI
jgi:hypothetical protein